MKDLYEKYVPWKILQYFALNPTTRIYVKELARTLDLSVGMCSIILKKMEADRILVKEELGKAHYYKLNDNYFTRELKRFMNFSRMFENRLVENILEENDQIISIVLYGSYAKGDFLEDSDLDILIIATSKKKANLKKLAGDLGLVINTNYFSPGQWLKMKKKKSPFYSEVIKKHVLLYGGDLP
jgi:predicted nucleotidyltransferase